MKTKLIALALAALLLPVATFARDALIFKDPSCGCCEGWANYLKDHGYKVKTVDRDDMDKLKDGLGVPQAARSCHTARIEGYVIEGHVPVEAIDKLLAERPKVRGLASPGMPMGSPGMSGAKEPNPVYTFGDGGTKLFGQY